MIVNININVNVSGHTRRVNWSAVVLAELQGQDRL